MRWIAKPHATLRAVVRLTCVASLGSCTLSRDLDSLTTGSDTGGSGGGGGAGGAGASSGSGGYDSGAPVPPQPPLQRIAAGGNHACVIDASKRVFCWGGNQFGQLGLPTSTTQTSRPTLVPGVTGVSVIAAGNFHTCAFGEAGSWCWGQGAQGELGDGKLETSATPVSITLPGIVTLAAAGGSHTCVAAGPTRQVSCWGSNNGFQSSSTQSPSAVATPTATGLTQQFSVAAGGKHTCVAPSAGTARCWGDNTSGQLGSGTQGDSVTPVDVLLAMDVTQLASRASHTCAIVKTNMGAGLRCWGRNDAGQLGNGSVGGQELSPVAVSGGLAPIRVAVGSDHTCAIVTGSAHCWGSNAKGQLGDGTLEATPTPQPVSLPASVVAFDVATGTGFTCALTLPQGGSDPDAIWCWGNNASGQSGALPSNAEPTPVQLQL